MMYCFWSISLLPITALCSFIGPSPSSRLQATKSSGTHTLISLTAESNHESTEFFETANLLEKAKAIDGSLARGDVLGDYSESTWSNRCVCGLVILSLKRKWLSCF